MERKRKASSVDHCQQQVKSRSFQLKTRRLDVSNTKNSSCESVSSDQILASCCTSNGSSELTQQNSNFLDLEEEENVEFCATTSTDDHSLDHNETRKETTALSEMEAESSSEVETTENPNAANLNFRRRTMAKKIPSEDEIEEFFAAAEKNLHKQFIDKYNYDIVKDEPLEGRYEWIPIHQTHDHIDGFTKKTSSRLSIN